MIFVTVGTYEAPFDRLLAAIDEIEVGEPLVVQCGHSHVRPRRAEVVDFMPFEVVEANARRCRTMVAHAGVGSVLVALRAGKRPILIPRMHVYGEAVDDHQLTFGRKLAAIGLAVLIEDPVDLAAALRGDPGVSSVVPAIHAGRLQQDLLAYLAAVTAEDDS